MFDFPLLLVRVIGLGLALLVKAYAAAPFYFAYLGILYLVDYYYFL